MSSIDKSIWRYHLRLLLFILVLGTPIVDDIAIIKLCKMYKNTFPKQYDSMKKILGFNKKEGLE